jgi:hypothetical protein
VGGDVRRCKGERRDGDQWRDGKGDTNIKMEMNLDASIQ